jgi:hypothetical protein
MRYAKLAGALTAVLLLGACALEPLQPRRPGAAGQGGEAGAASRLPAAARKEVAEKRDVNRLIARDGTMCTVSAAVFQATAVGDRVTCLWQRAL